MLLRKESKRQRRAAFTLMEMLVVVAIIVALAGIGGYFLMGALGQSQEQIARAKMKTVEGACQQYKIDNNDYPDTLVLLTTKKEGTGRKYLEEDAILDPWKKEFTYTKTGGNNNNEKPDISCTSPEGKIIANWDKTVKKQ